MQKIQLFTLFVMSSLGGFSAKAQVTDAGGQQNLNTLGAATTMAGVPVQTFDARYQGVKGSPFLRNYWATGEVTLQDGRTFSNLPLKFDVYSETLAAKRLANDSVLLNSAQVKAFVFRDATLNLNQRFHRLPFSAKGTADAKGSFFEVLHEGATYALLRKHRKSILKASYQGAYSANRPYDEFTESSDLFLRLPGRADLMEVKLNRKSLLATLGDRKAEAEKLIGQEKIDVKTEVGAIRLLERLEK